ncbi:hypothetical protein B0J17DRAFT_460813 [Rhizoctonia solani]|nr:hypothetical protein B0J17DRAFT_460813 [Rhizoctonia solani]
MSDRISQASWRNDIRVNNYGYTQTLFVGGQDGDIWNDLRFIGGRSSARISRITTRSSGAGYLSSIQTTYTFLLGGYPTHQESPFHGTEDGPVTTWNLIMENTSQGFAAHTMGARSVSFSLRLTDSTFQLSRAEHFGREYSGASLYGWEKRWACQLNIVRLGGLGCICVCAGRSSQLGLMYRTHQKCSQILNMRPHISLLPIADPQFGETVLSN